MFLKLPFYALALYLATRIPGFSPAAIIAGAVQVPMLFAADALRTIRNEARPAIVAPEPTADLKRATQSVKAVHSELTGERG